MRGCFELLACCVPDLQPAQGREPAGQRWATRTAGIEGDQTGQGHGRAEAVPEAQGSLRWAIAPTATCERAFSILTYCVRAPLSLQSMESISDRW